MCLKKLFIFFCTTSDLRRESWNTDYIFSPVRLHRHAAMMIPIIWNDQCKGVSIIYTYFVVLNEIVSIKDIKCPFYQSAVARKLDCIYKLYFLETGCEETVSGTLISGQFIWYVKQMKCRKRKHKSGLCNLTNEIQQLWILQIICDIMYQIWFEQFWTPCIDYCNKILTYIM